MREWTRSPVFSGRCYGQKFYPIFPTRPWYLVKSRDIVRASFHLFLYLGVAVYQIVWTSVLDGLLCSFVEAFNVLASYTLRDPATKLLGKAETGLDLQV